MGLETTVPLVVVGIIALVVVIFIIKSLIKFAFVAAVIALLIFLAWQFGAFQFLASYLPDWIGRFIPGPSGGWALG